jgi:signal-transduction protein with cAMP-binding, CBS, and nucleotidyltransferase domain
MFTTTLVNDILNTKGHGYLGMPPEATAYAALEVMADHDVGALMVMEDGGQLVGIFSERDYARKVILKGKSSRSTTVGELMSSPPICASPEMNLQECMMLMTNNHVRHLPVMDDGQVIGVVSIGDVVNSIMRSQEVTINQLENYITGDDYPARVAMR